VIAIHGMNDYSNAFDDFAKAAAKRGILVYAYDQRGFGRALNPGIWAGWQTMTRDLRDITLAVHERNPGLPLYILGESMGGAVAICAAADGYLDGVTGLVLSAPGVWGRKSMNWVQRATLWIARKIAPGWSPTGRDLKIAPSDNKEILKQLFLDPLVIKKTRIDAVAGVVDLMDMAQSRIQDVKLPALVLYGANDQVIPPEPFWAAVGRLPALGNGQEVAFYPNGWHMLFRDLQAAIVWEDVMGWMQNRGMPLVSGADKKAREKMNPRA
jgi:alpha-beta hydrolase superfamily lysophospholipase